MLVLVPKIFSSLERNKARFVSIGLVIGVYALVKFLEEVYRMKSWYNPMYNPPGDYMSGWFLKDQGNNIWLSNEIQASAETIGFELCFNNKMNGTILPPIIIGKYEKDSETIARSSTRRTEPVSIDYNNRYGYVSLASRVPPSAPYINERHSYRYNQS